MNLACDQRVFWSHWRAFQKNGMAHITVDAGPLFYYVLQQGKLDKGNYSSSVKDYYYTCMNSEPCCYFLCCLCRWHPGHPSRKGREMGASAPFQMYRRKSTLKGNLANHRSVCQHTSTFHYLLTRSMSVSSARQSEHQLPF